MQDDIDALGSDDSNISDFFPSSPSSHRFTSPAAPDCRDVNLTVSKQRTLPLELIDYIIQLFHRRYRSFCILRPLSEVSSQFRSIALRTYMTTLRIHSAKHLSSLAKMHICMLSRANPAWECKGLHWVKTLTAQAVDLAKAPWRPSLLCILQTLHISFANEARSTQITRSKQIFVMPLTLPMLHLTSLTLTELWRIDVSLLSMVSAAFPGLTSLHLSCSEHLDMSCCWSCFEDSSSAVVHSPIPNHFPTVASLTNAFAKALKPLTKLADLHLGIFLSDEEILENHINHYDSPRAHSRTSSGQNGNVAYTATILSQSSTTSGHVSFTRDEEDLDSPNLNIETNEIYEEVLLFPHGPELCQICSIVISAPDVRTRELEASLALARKLKSLKTIGWSSFFAWQQPSGDKDKRKIGDWQRMTETYILRSSGRVRVRRRPWD